VVSPGEAASYNSDSKQTIPGPVGHRVEIGEAVAIGGLSFFLQPSLFVCCTFFSHFVFERRHFRRDSAHIVARRDARPGRLRVAGESNNIRIRNVYSSFEDGRYVFVDSDNKIGTLVSWRRFKAEIKPMDRASETIHALKPVTFRYKKEIDSAGTSQFGLVAEDVEKVSPALIVRDKEGKPYSVRY
jgi:hypothetical protein